MQQPFYDEPGLFYDSLTFDGLPLTYDGVAVVPESSGGSGGEAWVVQAAVKRRKRKRMQDVALALLVLED